MTGPVSKYTDPQREFIRRAWDAGTSAAIIAVTFNAHFGTNLTRSAVIGLCKRMKLTARGSDGPWRIEGQARRAANAEHTPRKPPAQSLPTAPSEQPPAIGPLGDHVDHGCCKWPVSAENGPFQQCGHPAVERKPYCSFHKERAKGAQPKHPMTGQSASDRQFRG